MFCILQSFLAGLAASGAITSALRLITKAAFENSKDGLRKGAGKFEFFLLICSLRNGEKKRQLLFVINLVNTDDFTVFCSFILCHLIIF